MIALFSFLLDMILVYRDVLEAQNSTEWGGMEVVCSIRNNKRLFFTFIVVGQEAECGQAEISCHSEFPCFLMGREAGVCHGAHYSYEDGPSVFHVQLIAFFFF